MSRSRYIVISASLSLGRQVEPEQAVIIFFIQNKRVFTEVSMFLL